MCFSTVCAVYIAEQNVKEEKKIQYKIPFIYIYKTSTELVSWVLMTSSHSWKPLYNVWPLLEEMLHLVTHAFLLLLCWHTCACGVKQASEIDYGMQHLMFIWNSMLITQVSSHISEVWPSAVSHWHVFQYSALFLVNCQKIMRKSFFLNDPVFLRLDGIVWFPFLC